MNNETEKKVVYHLLATKLPVGDLNLIKEINDEASMSSLVNKGRQVFLKVSSLGNTLQGTVFTHKDMTNAHKVYTIKDKEQISGEEDGYNFSSLVDIQSLVTKGNYKACVVGKRGTCIILEVEESLTVRKKANRDSAESIKEAEQESSLSKEDLEYRVKLLEGYGIKKGNPLMADIIKAIKKQPEGFEIEKPTRLYQDNPKHKIVEDVLTMLVRGQFPILQGPKSVGKNVLWETIGYILNCRTFMLQCNSRMTYANMYGSTGTDNSCKEGITEERAKEFLSLGNGGNVEEASKFMTSMAMSMSPTLTLSPGPITEAIMWGNKGYGAILLLDEMNLSDPNTLSGAVNAITDGHTKSIYIKDLGVVDLSDNLIIGATQNGVGGNYLGTKVQNDATLSRFNCVILDNPSSIAPILRLVKADVDDMCIQNLDRVFTEFSGLVHSGVSESCLNIRGFQRAVELISMGMDLKKAVTYCIVNTVPNEDDIRSLKASLDNLDFSATED